MMIEKTYPILTVRWLELSLFDFSVKKEEGRNESVDFSMSPSHQ